jgi:hypothetical protein
VVTIQQMIATAREKLALLGSAGCQPAGRGSLGKKRIRVTPDCIRKECWRQNCRQLQACGLCSPETERQTDSLPGIRGCAQIDGVTLVCNDGNLL